MTDVAGVQGVETAMDDISTKEAAKRLGVHPKRVLALINTGKLKAKKPARDWLIDPASVDAYAQSPRRAGRPKQNHGGNGMLGQHTDVGR